MRKYLLLLLLFFSPPANAQTDEATPAAGQKQVELFLTALLISDNQITAAQVTWLPGHLVNGCMGRTLHGCQTLEYEESLKPRDKRAPRADLRQRNPRDIPPTLMTEWITAEERYGGSAQPLLSTIGQLPAVQQFMEKSPAGVNYQQNFEPMQVRHAFKARVYYELSGAESNFRVLEILR